jgi:hypothetical protein
MMRPPGSLNGSQRQIKTQHLFSGSFARFELIAKRDPNSVMAHRDRQMAVRKLVDLGVIAGRFSEAATWADREIEIQTAKGVPAYPEREAELSYARLIRELCPLVDKCIDNPAVARAQRPEAAVQLLAARAVRLARMGRNTEAIEAARELLTLPNANYVLAEAARVNLIVISSLGDSRREEKNRCRKLALEALRKAIASSTINIHLAMFYVDFLPYRNDPDFMALTGPAAGNSKGDDAPRTSADSSR